MNGTAPPSAPSGEEERPLLPDTTADERAEGWGESGSAGFTDEDYLREVPPHHG